MFDIETLHQPYNTKEVHIKTNDLRLQKFYLQDNVGLRQLDGEESVGHPTEDFQNE